jgi:hypothetical protein
MRDEPLITQVIIKLRLVTRKRMEIKKQIKQQIKQHSAGHLPQIDCYWGMFLIGRGGKGGVR